MNWSGHDAVSPLRVCLWRRGIGGILALLLSLNCQSKCTAADEPAAKAGGNSERSSVAELASDYVEQFISKQRLLADNQFLQSEADLSSRDRDRSATDRLPPWLIDLPKLDTETRSKFAAIVEDTLRPVDEALAAARTKSDQQIATLRPVEIAQAHHARGNRPR